MAFPFAQAAGVLKILNENGFEAYVVGGAVRDYLLGRPVHDIDIATSARPSEVRKLFARTIPVGIEHGTVVVLHDGGHYEVTTFRSESEYDDFRHPNQVRFETSLLKDLMRRDFTINAMAIAESGELIDPYQGQRDLQMKRIRTVGKAEKRIEEDPLRMMRGIRFVSELDFALGDVENRAFQECSFLLEKISVERIDQEMTKLLAGKAAGRGLLLMNETHCTAYLPCLKRKREDVALFARMKLGLLNTDDERWGAFLIGLNIADVHHFARSWKWSAKREKAVQTLCRAYHAMRWKNWDLQEIYRWGLENALAVERLKTAFGETDEIQLASMMKKLRRLWQLCPIHSRKALAVNGDDLLRWTGRIPGPWVARLLETLEQLVLTGLLHNNKEAIREWVQVWLTQRNKF